MSVKILPFFSPKMYLGHGRGVSFEWGRGVIWYNLTEL
jgi:hypothetical protein